MITRSDGKVQAAVTLPHFRTGGGIRGGIRGGRRRDVDRSTLHAALSQNRERAAARFAIKFQSDTQLYRQFLHLQARSKALRDRPTFGQVAPVRGNAPNASLFLHVACAVRVTHGNAHHGKTVSLEAHDPLVHPACPAAATAADANPAP